MAFFYGSSAENGNYYRYGYKDPPRNPTEKMSSAAEEKWLELDVNNSGDLDGDAHTCVCITILT